MRWRAARLTGRRVQVYKVRVMRLPLRFALLLLPCLVLLAQFGAVAHELSHAYYSGKAAGAQLTAQSQLEDESHCPTCRSFQQLSHAASNAVAELPAIISALLRTPDRVYSVVGARAPTARSRGPPHTSV